MAVFLALRTFPKRALSRPRQRSSPSSQSRLHFIDGVPLILRALALHLLNLRLPALRAVDFVLSSPSVRSLSDRERADTLLKRAQIHREIHRRRRADQAIADLSESVRLSPENGKAFCLLGECYEEKGEAEMVIRVFESALRIDASSAATREEL